MHLAALEDQRLFNALAGEDLLREVLADESFRARLNERLLALSGHTPAVAMAGAPNWLQRPAASCAIGIAALALATSAGALIRSQRRGRPSGGLEYSAGPSRDKVLVPKLSLPATAAPDNEVLPLELLWNSAETSRAKGVALNLDCQGDPPVYAQGKPLRIEFSVPWEASVLLLSKGPNGMITRLFPDDRCPSMLVRTNEKVAIILNRYDDSRLAGPMARHSLRLRNIRRGSDVRVGVATFVGTEG